MKRRPSRARPGGCGLILLSCCALAGCSSAAVELPRESHGVRRTPPSPPQDVAVAPPAASAEPTQRDLPSVARQADGAERCQRRTVGTLAAGTRFATPYAVVESCRPGPTVLVVAGIHGNEPAPPLAVEQVPDWPIVRGRLLVIPRVNPAAREARSRFTPRARYSDLNRNFPIAGRPVRGKLASLLWQQTRDWQPDWVFDLHEGWGVHRTNRETVGSTVTWVSGTAAGERARPVGKRVLAAVNATIESSSKRFELISPGPAGSFARAVSEKLDVPSLVLETTRLGQPLELRIEQQRLMLRAALGELGTLP